MASKVKCPTCKKTNNKEDTVKHGNRYYCKECYENISKRDEYWDDLFTYITEIFNIDKPTPLMFKQIKDYKKEPYNFTDKGIYLTLKYCKEILNKNFEDYNSGIGIVPYYYERTLQHYINIDNIEESLENFHVNEDVKIINVKLKNNPFKKKETLSYDIDWSEDDFDNEEN
ncbi:MULTISPECIES: hypothetical protein [unclassified Clostridium]|uniref:hypothetical protein n=1 Tax=unclassified Clostridium TaxID=2614128 RepID=UPI0025BD8037|nr:MULTISPECIES: hypothetical protein [unclassified Clostridium]